MRAAVFFGIPVLVVFALVIALVATFPVDRDYDYVAQEQVITLDGQLYIAGEGDTCLQARSFAVYPNNIRSIDCRIVRVHKN